MRKIASTMCMAIIVATAGCGKSEPAKVSVTPTPHNANKELVEKGKSDARAAMAFDSGSSERINAVLEIHAKAYELSQRGMPNCAEDYLNGAKEVIGATL